MLEFNTPKKAKSVQRDKLFSLDGKVYTIPVRFQATHALEYVDSLRKYGPDIANSTALEIALGQDGYDALLGAGDAISAEDIAVLVNVVTSRMLGKAIAVPSSPKEDTYLASSPVEPESETAPQD